MSQVPQAISDFFSRTTVPLTISDAREFDHPLLMVNAAFCLMTGYTKSEVEGRNCRFLQSDFDNEGPRADIRRALAESNDVQVLLNNKRASGEEFRNLLLLYSINDSQGAPVFFLGSQFDVTHASQRTLDVHGNLLDRGVSRVLSENDRLHIHTKRVLAEGAVKAVRAKLAAI